VLKLSYRVGGVDREWVPGRDSEYTGPMFDCRRRRSQAVYYIVIFSGTRRDAGQTSHTHRGKIRMARKIPRQDGARAGIGMGVSGGESEKPLPPANPPRHHHPDFSSPRC